MLMTTVTMVMTKLVLRANIPLRYDNSWYGDDNNDGIGYGKDDENSRSFTGAAPQDNRSTAHFFLAGTHLRNFLEKREDPGN